RTRVMAVQRGRLIAPLLLLIMPVCAWGILGTPGAYSEAGSAHQPVVSDSGVLTTWNLPPNRGPWQMKWDASRNMMWFAEGNHSDPPLDQIGALNPDTNVLKEWGVPTGFAY